MSAILIIGAGLSGLRAAKTVAERGHEAILLSRLNARQAASGCAQGGINAALNHMNDGDSVHLHFEDTIRGGDYMADQAPVLRLCEDAPNILAEAASLGALLTRLPDGRLAQRFLGGASARRACYAGASTGQALLQTYDNALLPLEAAGRVRRMEGLDFVSLILDGSGRCRGCVAKDYASGELTCVTADATIMATGGASAIYGQSTNPVLSNGAAIAAAYVQGAPLSNMEFVQFHPTAMPGRDKARLITEAVRGEGGRIWTLRDGEPWYFLEEMFPEKGNLITRDEASRAIMRVCQEMGLGIDGKPQVYLDVTHLPEAVRRDKLGSVLALYQKFSGEDPAMVPMRVYPAAHYFMGGLRVDGEHRTAIPGLWACGECDQQYHGANRLGGNSLLSALHSGGVAANGAIDGAGSDGPADAMAMDELKKQRSRDRAILAMKGPEPLGHIMLKLGEILRDAAFIYRDDRQLLDADAALCELSDRLLHSCPMDDAQGANYGAMLVRQLQDQLPMARAIVHSALWRHKSRGAHAKKTGGERSNLLLASVAKYGADAPDISYVRVDTSVMGGPGDA